MDEVKKLYAEIEKEFGQEPGIWGRLAARATIQRNRLKKAAEAVIKSGASVGPLDMEVSREAFDKLRDECQT